MQLRQQVIILSTPLFGHRLCNAWKCFCPVFCSVSGKHPFVLLFMLARVRARWTPRCNRFDDICWTQRIKPFQPKASFLAVWVSIFIRLHSLRIRRQTENLTRYGILHADSRHIRPPEPHKQVAALNAKHHAVSLKLVSFPEMPCTGIAQVCAGRVCNEQVPLANVMRYTVHRHDLPPLQSLERISKNMPLGMPAGRLLNVA